MRLLKHRGEFVVLNKKGLHMRPATELVRRTQRFHCALSLAWKGRVADGKSLLNVVALAAPLGAHIVVEAEGEDAEEAVGVVVTLAKQYFRSTY